jgi:hypothetical protein
MGANVNTRCQPAPETSRNPDADAKQKVVGLEPDHPLSAESRYRQARLVSRSLRSWRRSRAFERRSSFLELCELIEQWLDFRLEHRDLLV